MFPLGMEDLYSFYQLVNELVNGRGVSAQGNSVISGMGNRGVSEPFGHWYATPVHGYASTKNNGPDCSYIRFTLWYSCCIFGQRVSGAKILAAC